MISAPITLTYDRVRVVDVSAPIAVAERSFIWYRPEGGADLLGFVKPLTVDVCN